MPVARRHPEWIRTKLISAGKGTTVRDTLCASGLHTVCEEARCPNRGECWDAGTATFLILGNTCTRGCRYCSVNQGTPALPDNDEPSRIAHAAMEMGCKYVVVTSVTRDDLPDGGAGQFASVVTALKDAITGVRIELLVPDFNGNRHSMIIVTDAQPDVLAHNIETVKRLFPTVRPSGNYEMSLNMLESISPPHTGVKKKSGIMVGLGESYDEVLEAFDDLLHAGVEIVTAGQYLQPTRECVPVERYWHPEEFDKLKDDAMKMGFRAAICGPLVRSSYHAEEIEKLTENK